MEDGEVTKRMIYIVDKFHSRNEQMKTDRTPKDELLTNV